MVGYWAGWLNNYFITIVLIVCWSIVNEVVDLYDGIMSLDINFFMYYPKHAVGMILQ